MIADKRLKLIKSEDGINYYLFKPTLFSLYYNDREHKHSEEPPHRFALSHKMRMMWYILSVRKGYSILYLERDGEILSYIVFVKANSKIIKNCGKNDYYTVFLWTYPEHRGKGLATLMSKTMLQDLHLEYDCFYKTISKDNISSIRVAEKCGFDKECECVRTKWWHTICRVESGIQFLYSYSKK